MSIDVEELAKLRSYLQKKIEETRLELQYLETLIKIIDSILAKSSFKPASQIRVEGKSYRIFSRKLGENVGELIIYSEKGIAVLRPYKAISVEDRIFQNFFVREVLEKHKRTDEELVRRGEILDEEAFDYEIRDEDGMLKEVIIRNFREERRLRDIRGAFRWTIEIVTSRKQK